MVIYIASRERDPRLQALFDAGKNVYSFSKLSSIGNCPYGAYLSYIAHQKRRKQGVWGVLGGKFHDKLEEIVNGEATKEELIPLVGQELAYLDMLGIEFPKDFKGGDSIRNNWITDMEHFSKHFEPLEGEYRTEELMLLKIDDDNYMQGYADLLRENEDGSVSVLDWKTSSLYDKEEFEHAAHQLVIYGMAEEAAGRKIKDLAWIFMKYVEITFMGRKRANSKTDTLITKVVERRKIASELRKYIENDLYHAGYDEMQSDIYLNQMMKSNSLEALPDEIKNKYTIKQYIKTIPYDEEAKENTMQYILDTIADFERRGRDEKNWEPRSFTKISKTGKETEDTFYCNALCDFGNTCKYIELYNEERKLKDKSFEEWF